MQRGLKILERTRVEREFEVSGRKQRPESKVC
jgi:hypothetical protein